MTHVWRFMPMLGLAACLWFAGCAANPPPTPASTAGAAASPRSPTLPSTTAASATGSMSVPNSQKKPPPGYKQRVRGGQVVYCRTEQVSGSRFEKELCWPPETLEEILETNENEADTLFRKQRPQNCGMAGCAGG
jgi:hypothetical protein